MNRSQHLLEPIYKEHASAGGFMIQLTFLYILYVQKPYNGTFLVS